MDCMNDAERERFLASLRTDDDFRAAVRRELLTEELLNLPQTVAALVDAVAQQRQDFTDLARSVAQFMERTISALQEGFAGVRAELSEMRSEMGEMRSETGAMRSEMGEMRSEMGEMVGTVDDLGTGLRELRSDMDAGFTAVQAKFDQINADIQDLRKRLAS